MNIYHNKIPRNTFVRPVYVYNTIVLLLFAVTYFLHWLISVVVWRLRISLGDPFLIKLDPYQWWVFFYVEQGNVHFSRRFLPDSLKISSNIYGTVLFNKNDKHWSGFPLMWDLEMFYACYRKLDERNELKTGTPFTRNTVSSKSDSPIFFSLSVCLSITNHKLHSYM